MLNKINRTSPCVQTLHNSHFPGCPPGQPEVVLLLRRLISLLKIRKLFNQVKSSFSDNEVTSVIFTQKIQVSCCINKFPEIRTNYYFRDGHPNLSIRTFTFKNSRKTLSWPKTILGTGFLQESAVRPEISIVVSSSIKVSGHKLQSIAADNDGRRAQSLKCTRKKRIKNFNCFLYKLK